MPLDLARHLAEVRRDGPRRFAHWNADLFDAVAAGPAQALADGLGDAADASATLLTYLRLVQEGVGLGLVRQTKAGDAGWTSFLERCLVELVPPLLPQEPPETRGGLLVGVWNVGEGLRGGPGWLDRYVCICAGGLRRLGELEAFLAEVLEPVLTPRPPAAWKGPFAVTVLDLRPWHDDFLPGRMFLAAPSVVCVPDRRQLGVQLGVLLAPGGQSRALGLTAGLTEHREEDLTPALTFDDGQLLLADAVVEVPGLRRCYHHVSVAGGLVAACAIDSQRLWIVETP
jgi:hypothetical protein